MSDGNSCYDGTFNICVAMCDSNRGFGLNGHHPWPHIPTDFRFYMDLTGKPKDADKLLVNIKGRVTWEGSSTREQSRPDIVNVLISGTLSGPPNKNVESVFPTLSEALQYLSSSEELSTKIESVWVMGGEQLYNEALKHPACRRVYLTRIYGEYRSDRFLDEFEDDFQLVEVELSVDSNKIYDENGVKYKFEVYERKT